MSNRAPYDTNQVTNCLTWMDTNNVRTSHRKESNPSSHIIVTLKKPDANGYHHEVITIDVFYPKSRNGATVSACVWVHNSATGTHLAGSDSVGGWGYCKYSSAIDGAMASAGIEFKARFNGCGEQAVKVACAAIMKALGHRKNSYIITSR